MLKRAIEKELKKALSFSPVVLISGARQVGKTTLVTELKDRNYIVMDDITQLEAAKSDPQGYINSIKKPVTIDEIQKIPELLTPIKLYVDKNKNAGDFLLTGSANILNFKNSNETLAGRLIELTLYPFSAKEKNKEPNSNIVDALFEQDISTLEINISSTDLVEKFIIEGGYPLSFLEQDKKSRFLWFNSYISTYIERDIRSIGELRDLDNFIRFYNYLMPQSGNLLNKSNIAKNTKLNAITVDNYISLLEKVYQIYLLKPYFENIGKSFIKSPKLYLTDSGLLCHLLNVRDIESLKTSRYKGEIYETFVFAELLKHISYSQNIINFHYYRTADKKEIDFILQKDDYILAIEVKAAMSIKKDDFRHIIDFQNRSSKKVTGIVFYNGKSIVCFGKKLYAIGLGYFL